MKPSRLVALLLLIGVLGGCPKESAPEPSSEPAADPPSTATPGPKGTDHGTATTLGELPLGEWIIKVRQLGHFMPGVESAVAMTVVKAPEGADPTAVALTAWAVDATGKYASAPDKARRENDAMHAHVVVRADAGVPVAIVVRLRVGATDVRGQLAVSRASRYGGVAAPLAGPDGATARVELKLHDDKGDLELWLWKDGSMTEPLDVPLDARVTARFPELEGRTATLAPRDTDKNADEAGRPNLRDGRTNYVIFPGGTGVDASWLKGGAFRSPAAITIQVGEDTWRAEPFELVPHVTGPGGAHGHPH